MKVSREDELLEYGKWVKFGRDMRRAEKQIEVVEQPTKTVVCGNTVDGSLDRRSIPERI